MDIGYISRVVWTGSRCPRIPGPGNIETQTKVNVGSKKPAFVSGTHCILSHCVCFCSGGCQSKWYPCMRAALLGHSGIRLSLKSDRVPCEEFFL